MSLSKIALVTLVGLTLMGAGCNFTKGASTDTKAEIKTETPTYLSALPEGIYAVDTKESKLTWQGKMIAVSKSHKGTIDFKTGSAVVKGKNASGEFVIDMNTIADEKNTERLEQHLKSDDFFAVSKYPTATLTITQISPALAQSAEEQTTFLVAGDLTIKGITKPVTFNAKFQDDNGKLVGLANFSIDRSMWDVRYGSGKFFSNLGDKVIDDKIEFDLRLVANK